jgi:hypothetical protein|tara:strand:- start:157 stop:294 length:138 start_codon:yes stop_codon:yes gene_type:complete
LFSSNVSTTPRYQSLQFEFLECGIRGDGGLVDEPRRQWRVAVVIR